jgi:hypothetical protein
MRTPARQGDLLNGELSSDVDYDEHVPTLEASVALEASCPSGGKLVYLASG